MSQQNPSQNPAKPHPELPDASDDSLMKALKNSEQSPDVKQGAEEIPHEIEPQKEEARTEGIEQVGDAETDDHSQQPKKP